MRRGIYPLFFAEAKMEAKDLHAAAQQENRINEWLPGPGRNWSVLTRRGSLERHPFLPPSCICNCDNDLHLVLPEGELALCGAPCSVLPCPPGGPGACRLSPDHHGDLTAGSCSPHPQSQGVEWFPGRSVGGGQCQMRPEPLGSPGHLLSKTIITPGAPPSDRSQRIPVRAGSAPGQLPPPPVCRPWESP